VFRAFALVDGTAAAIWRIAAGKIEIEPFSALHPAAAVALERDGRDVLRFLGGLGGGHSG
jgi:hypothetical protein